VVAPTVGLVVLVPFPFSDLSASKLRPALVLAKSGRGDWVCVQITSNPYSDPKAIELTAKDFTDGGLNRVSYVRPGKLFTANETLFRRSVARVSKQKLSAIVDAVILLLRNHR
jgi:mRNA interferase MazF